MKVEQLMAAKVKAKDLWQDKGPSLYNKLILELACEIHYSESNSCSVSWEAQERAMNYFNENGFEKTLDYMIDLQTKRESNV